VEKEKGSLAPGRVGSEVPWGYGVVHLEGDLRVGEGGGVVYDVSSRRIEVGCKMNVWFWVWHGICKWFRMLYQTCLSFVKFGLLNCRGPSPLISEGGVGFDVISGWGAEVERGLHRS